MKRMLWWTCFPV